MRASLPASISSPNASKLYYHKIEGTRLGYELKFIVHLHYCLVSFSLELLSLSSELLTCIPHVRNGLTNDDLDLTRVAVTRKSISDIIALRRAIRWTHVRPLSCSQYLRAKNIRHWLPRTIRGPTLVNSSSSETMLFSRTTIRRPPVRV